MRFFVQKIKPIRWGSIGLLVGIVYAGFTFSGIWSLYPLSFIGIENPLLSLAIVFIIYAGSTLAVALPWGMLGTYLFWLKKRTVPAWLLPLVATSGFVLAEYLRAWIFSLLWYGKGSVFGPHLTFGNPVYLLAGFPPAMWIASALGMYGVEFLFALPVFIVFFWYKTKNVRACLFSLAVFLLFIALSVVSSWQTYTDSPQKSLSVAILQTKTESRPLETSDQQIEDISAKLDLFTAVTSKSEEQPDLIVFPETANFSERLLSLFSSSGLETFFAKHLSSSTVLIDSERVSLSDQTYRSRAVLTDRAGTLPNSYDKIILTPWGEFLPYIAELPLGIISPEMKSKFQDLRQFLPGSTKSTISINGMPTTLLVCSDAVSPIVPRVPDMGLFVGMGSIAPYRGNAKFDAESRAMGQFRAAENGKYLVWASNYGQSYIADPTGRLIALASPNNYSVLHGTVFPSTKRTWYNRLGDAPILLFSLFFVSIVVVRRNWRK